MLVHSNTKLANLRETSVSFFVYCLFCCRTLLGALWGAPAAKAPPPERSEELFAVVCRTSIFNLPKVGDVNTVGGVVAVGVVGGVVSFMAWSVD